MIKEIKNVFLTSGHGYTKVYNKVLKAVSNLTN